MGCHGGQTKLWMLETVKLYKIYIYIYACFPSQVIFTEPADVGFSCIARKRAFQIFVDRTKGRFVANPAEIYQALCDGLGSRHLTIGHLMDFASSEDLKLELGLQGKSMDSYPGNLLSSFETKNKDEYERILSNKYSDGIPADPSVLPWAESSKSSQVEQRWSDASIYENGQIAVAPWSEAACAGN